MLIVCDDNATMREKQRTGTSEEKGMKQQKK